MLAVGRGLRSRKHDDQARPLNNTKHPSHGPDDEAVSFFADGQLLRRYDVCDLVTFECLLDTYPTLDWCETRRLDDPASRYAVTTHDGNAYVFDLPTGSIVHPSRRVQRLLKSAALIVIVIAGIVLTAVSLRRGQTGTAGTPTASHPSFG